MQVVNQDTFLPTEHLIGQKNETKSFGVSNDPALMAMLSTGLYANPHRTMIQELLFNAWDAHKMNGNTETPIDVYINKTSGLIVRDYGPGIEPGENDENITGVYCIYGYSSKRKDSNMTGGFGLGSKAPFAYTESFNVVSNYNGTKNIYLIRRVAEDNDGRPGMTNLIRVPTTDHGLMVTIPLKNNDEERTRDIIRNLSFLSGLKINLYFEEEPVEEIRAQTLAPHSFTFGNEDSYAYYAYDEVGFYAVYGGVRYKIPKDSMYIEELNQIQNLLNNEKILYLGFPPNTLTPTPNREALNLNEKTKEAIKQAMEVFLERFLEVIKPIPKHFIQISASNIHEETKDPILGLYRCLRIGISTETLPVDVLLRHMSKFAPNDPTDKNLWHMGVMLIHKFTEYFLKNLEFSSWYQEILKCYAMLYPEGIKYITQLRSNEEMRNRIFEQTEYSFTQTMPIQAMRFLFNNTALLENMKLVNSWNSVEAFPMVPKVLYRNKWVPVQQKRPIISSTVSGKTKGLIKVRSGIPRKSGKEIKRGFQFNSIYIPDPSTRNSNDFHCLSSLFFLPRYIILAKNQTCLNQVSMGEFLASISPYKNLRYDELRSLSTLINDESVFGLVVTEKNGLYSKAKDMLISRGYTIFDAPEPIRPKKRETPVVRVEKPVGFRQLPVDFNLWYKPSDYLIRKEELIEKPEFYFYRTKGDISGLNQKPRPERYFLGLWMQKHPNTVVINNLNQMSKMKALNVKNMEDVLPDFISEQLHDLNKFSNSLVLDAITNIFPLSVELLDYPTMRKAIGLNIPAKLKLADYENFKYLLDQVEQSSYIKFNPLKAWVTINKAFLRTDMTGFKTLIEPFRIFDSSLLGKKFEDTPPEEREAFVKKVIRIANSI